MLRRILKELRVLSPTFLVAFSVLFGAWCQADTLTVPNTFTPGTTIQSTPMNANFTAISALINGNIANDNIKASASINPTKLDLTVEYPILRSAAARCFSAGTTGDTVYRWTATADGDLFFGPGGSSALDLRLTRVDGNTLGLKNATTSYKSFAVGNLIHKTASFDLIETAASIASANRTITKRDPGADVDACYLTSGATATAGGVVYGTGSQSTLNITSAGTSGKALISAGSSAPTWGTLGVTYGGTNIDASSAANGKLLIGNGSGYTLANLTQGSGISISNGSGSITISATGSGFTISTKTSGYTASDGGNYYYRMTTNDQTVTLPASPADGSVRKFKMVTAGKTATFALNGAETINHADGSSDQVLTLTSDDGVLELTAVSGGWDET